MPTFAVTAPPDTSLGLWVADTDVEAIALALEAHPEHDALSGLTAEMVSPDPPADNFTVWQTHDANGVELGAVIDGAFQPRPVESFSSGSLSVALDGIRLHAAKGEAGHLVRASDGARMDLRGEWEAARPPEKATQAPAPPDLVDAAAGDLDEMARAQGFADLADLGHLVSRVNLAEPGAVETFDAWKLTDGTKTGLLDAFPYLKEDL